MRKINLFFISIILFVSCQPTETEQTITIESKYSLTIPSFLTKVNNLNEDASLQYQHAWKEFYVITIDESKEELNKALKENNLTEVYSNDIKGYSNLLLDVFSESMTISSKSEIKDTLINGLSARTVQIAGRTEGINAYFSLGFIEGENNYYQIMAWTLADTKYQYDSEITKLIYSFKELSK